MLSDMYIDVGQADKAVTSLQHVINLYLEASLPDLFWCEMLMTLGRAYIALQRPNEAMPYLAQAHDRFARLPVDHVPKTWFNNTFHTFATIFLDLGETELAAELLGDRLRYESSYLLPDDPVRLFSLRRMAQVYTMLGGRQHLEKAVMMFLEVVDKGQKTLHKDMDESKTTGKLMTELHEKLERVTRTKASVVNVTAKQSVLRVRASDPSASTVARDLTMPPQRPPLCAEIAVSRNPIDDTSSGA